jgi:hypothetical protein
MLVTTLPIRTTRGDLSLELLRGGRVRISASPGVRIAGGTMTTAPRRQGHHLVITLQSTGPLHLPFASAEQAGAAAEKVRHAASLPGGVISGEALHSTVDPSSSELRALEPLRHMTDLEGLSPETALHLLAAVEAARRQGRNPRGYMLLPLPDNVWVEYERGPGGDDPRLLPGPVAVVAWERMRPTVPAAAADSDLDVIVRRLRAKAAGSP